MAQFISGLSTTLTVTDTFVVSSQAAMLALSTAEKGDLAVRTDTSKTYVLQAEPYSTLSNWVELLQPVTTITAGTGMSVTGAAPSWTVTNSAPDQTVSITAGTGITKSGTYPSFTITNSAPDQTVAISGGTGISTSGTYPNFTVTNTAPDQTVSFTGTDITIGGTYPAFTLTNSKPDQTVSLTGGGSVSITGTYPNFTITGGTSVSVTTKGDLQTFSTVSDRLPVGTDGQVLASDSVQATGLDWVDAVTASGSANELAYFTSASAVSSIADGNSGEVLTTNGAGVYTWKTITSEAWSLLGNSGTTAGTNFVGTTDAQDVVFKRNSAEALRIANGNIQVAQAYNTLFIEAQTAGEVGGVSLDIKGGDAFGTDQTGGMVRIYGGLGTGSAGGNGVQIWNSFSGGATGTSPTTPELQAWFSDDHGLTFYGGDGSYVMTGGYKATDGTSGQNLSIGTASSDGTTADQAGGSLGLGAGVGTGNAMNRMTFSIPFVEESGTTVQSSRTIMSINGNQVIAMGGYYGDNTDGIQLQIRAITGDGSNTALNIIDPSDNWRWLVSSNGNVTQTNLDDVPTYSLELNTAGGTEIASGYEIGKIGMSGNLLTEAGTPPTYTMTEMAYILGRYTGDGSTASGNLDFHTLTAGADYTTLAMRGHQLWTINYTATADGNEFWFEKDHGGADVQAGDALGNIYWGGWIQTETVFTEMGRIRTIYQGDGSTVSSDMVFSVGTGSADEEVLRLANNKAVQLGDGVSVEISADTAADTASGITAVFTAGTTIALGDVCYVGSDGKMELGDATTIATAGVVALALEPIAEDATGRFLLTGIAHLDTLAPAWTVGGLIYLGLPIAGTPTLYGQMTQTPPSATNEVVQILGVAIAADTIYFKPELAMIEVA